ncbi:DUF2339 domain-containing protein [Schaalia vaccimaxillae]|uniref:DUF2339 domain-containing protein n=1 Tax=Schaalia vaccimaxillae TaxID=183916 RepID=UPI0003B4F582|nr:DUF2339 domain-containing protein [Schaalia vaccimaxillae]
MTDSPLPAESPQQGDEAAQILAELKALNERAGDLSQRLSDLENRGRGRGQEATPAAQQAPSQAHPQPAAPQQAIPQQVPMAPPSQQPQHGYQSIPGHQAAPGRPFPQPPVGTPYQGPGLNPFGTAPQMPTPPAAAPQMIQPQPQSHPQQPRVRNDESRIGKYLLSGAAAVLILLAGATLMAMLWDSIPNIVKVGAVIVVAIALTATGAILNQTKPALRVPASTALGIGAGLGFVGFLGGTLLEVFPLVAAFICIIMWTVAVTFIAAKTQSAWTIGVSTLGGIVTVMLASTQGAPTADKSLAAAIMVVAYCIALTVTVALSSRFFASSTFRPIYPLTASIVTFASALSVPFEGAIAASAIAGLLLCVCLLALLIVQVFLCIVYSTNKEWRWAWIAVPIAYLMTSGRVEWMVENDTQALIFHYAAMAVILVAAGALLLPRVAKGSQVAASLSLTASMVVVLFSTRINLDDSDIHTVITLAALLLPAWVEFRSRSHYHVWIFSSLGLLQLFDRSTIMGICLGIALLVLVIALIVGADRLHPRASDAKILTIVLCFLLMTRLPFQLVAFSQVLDGSSGRNSFVWTLAVVAAFALIVILGISGGIPGAYDFVRGQRLGARPRMVSKPAAVARQAAYPGGPIQQVTVPQPDAPSSLAGIVVAAIGVAVMVTIGIAELGMSSWVFNDYDAEEFPVYHLLMGVLLLVVGALVAWTNAHVIRHTITGLITAAVCTLAPLQALTTATTTPISGIPASILLLVIGAGAIAVGFKASAKAVRLYGLTVVMLMVLKMALLDLGSQSNIMRVIALLIAGLICFGLSIIYSRVDNRLKADPEQAPPSAPVQAPVQPISNPPQAQPEPPAQTNNPFAPPNA